METDRLRVRKFREKDADPLYRLLSDPEVMRFLEPPYTRRQAEDFLAQAGLCTPPKILAVETRTGDFVGYVIWHPYGRDAWELGWVLCRDAWHKGYARELTKAFVEKARGRTGTLVLECAPAQQATRAIALQNRFVYAGREDGCDIYKLRLDGEKHTPPAP